MFGHTHVETVKLSKSVFSTAKLFISILKERSRVDIHKSSKHTGFRNLNVKINL